jgi:pimeloyl-ACP methyl ester carboxylesterase
LIQLRNATIEFQSLAADPSRTVLLFWGTVTHSAQERSHFIDVTSHHSLDNLGDQDKTIPLNPGAQFLHSLIPHSSLYVFANVGHALYVERSKQIAQIVAEAVLNPKGNSNAGKTILLD